MSDPSLSEMAVAIALAEAARGVLERNNDNRGDRIDEYEALAGGRLGLAWCAMFVYWCFEQAAQKAGVKNPFPRIFGASEFEAWATREDKMVPEPARGDVLIKEHRHVGLVTGPPFENGCFPSVEGNTWANSDYAHRREGVYVLKNEKVARCTFARLV
jgi:hypothetical protein